MTQTITRLGLLAAIIVAALALPAAPAAAHTELEKSTPAKDATVHELGEVTLVFSEKVRLAKVKVVDAGGTELQDGTAQVTGDTVAQPVSAGLAAGKYTLAYRVVSADGHPVQGTVPFRVATAKGAAAEQPAAAQSPDSQATSTAADGTQRWLMVGAGLLAGMGIGLAIVFLRRDRKTGQ